MLKTKLFLHQVESVKKMQELEESNVIMVNSENYVCTRLGILSDISGYGKSYSFLGLICETKVKKKEDDFYLERIIDKNDFFTDIRVNKLEYLECSVILVNISLVSQWETELNKTLLKYKIIYSKNEIENIDLESFDVLLISSTIFNLFARLYKQKCFRRFIMDEPFSLRISEPVHAKFYWLSTATPQELYTRQPCGFLKNLLPQSEYSFSKMVIKNDDEFVKQSFKMPATHHHYYHCIGNISKIFDGLISDNIVEMMDAGNIRGVYDSFEREHNSNTCMIELFLNRKNKRIEKLLKLVEENEINHEKDNNVVIEESPLLKSIDESVLPPLLELENPHTNKQRLLETKSHIETFSRRLAKFLNNNGCAFCLSQFHEYSKIIISSCCAQFFCGKCFEPFECPCCKTTDSKLARFKNLSEIEPLLNKHFIMGKLSFFYENENINTNIWEKTKNTRFSKLEKVMEIIEKKGKQAKILIFSNYNESFGIIKKKMNEAKILYLELKGTKETRDNTIERYKEEDINVLLLNTTQSGAGLNSECIINSENKIRKIQINEFKIYLLNVINTVILYKGVNTNNFLNIISFGLLNSNINLSIHNNRHKIL